MPMHCVVAQRPTNFFKFTHVNIDTSCSPEYVMHSMQQSVLPSIVRNHKTPLNGFNVITVFYGIIGFAKMWHKNRIHITTVVIVQQFCLNFKKMNETLIFTCTSVSVYFKSKVWRNWKHVLNFKLVVCSMFLHLILVHVRYIFRWIPRDGT